MKIDNYSFGQITVDGKSYVADLIIFPDRVDDKWWRKEGHLLQMDDLAEVFGLKPETLIVGLGLPGLMTIDDSVVDYCKSNNIILFSLPTTDAVSKYNELTSKKPLVIAALHLTC
ncbi:MAG: hypothetical protein KJ620_05790 [Candidatus Edwardsbacteria bacterium]|nr:hypothetical protein [Candidatus Edwardsbacteria bacterium]MBU1575891.1 hypothetical protein [Candidatus Edwardsbacteria bacterium]MBU2464337.1 hypothetical protein [Candidatus Edwardsbacteria bacterium]MBU2593104.1 hypothetical protein [Candidatus Edwardsbacteria bacterium]